MFQRDTVPTKHLHLVTGRTERSQLKGVSQMNEYKYAESSVASAVTLLVSAWFLVAAGAILADPNSPYTQRPTAEPTAQSAASIVVAEGEPQLLAVSDQPAARTTITVQARRLKV